MASEHAWGDGPTVGVVGLGRMGLPIAGRLRAAGLRVLGSDRRGEARAAAETGGVVWVDETAELAAAVDVVVTVLSGPEELRAAIEPIAAHLRDGGGWIDMTSAVPAVAEEIGLRTEGRIRTVECPVGGNPTTAAGGALVGYLGGAEADRHACRPLLDHLCGEYAHVGPRGSGYAVKLLVNLLWFGQAVAVSEALALAARLGLDPGDVRATLARGPAGSRCVEQDAERLLEGDDMTTFALARCLEELEGVQALAAGLDAELPVAARVTEVYAQALRHFGDVDGELLAARFVAERMGVRFGDASG